MNRQIAPRREQALEFAVVALALVLRLYSLGTPSLWLDEAVYANNAFNPFERFLALTRGNNSTPILLPLLYWMLGDLAREPIVARLPPVICGTLAVWVVLRLPQVGLSRRVAFFSALWLAVSPLQIQYSQEVREYSLSVLMTCLLVYALLKSLAANPEKRSDVLLIVMLILAPLSSYGDIFVAGLCTVLFLLHEFNQSRLSLGRAAPVVAGFSASMLCTYLITARYQLGVKDAEYLKAGFPPGEFLPDVAWLWGATVQYFASMSGGRGGVLVLVLAGAFAAWAFSFRRFERAETKVAALLSALLVASWGLAFLGLYPFGGIRQQLFATPLIAITCCAALDQLAALMRFRSTAVFAVAAVLLLPGLVRALPRVYQEQENIRSVVQEIDATTGDQDVFVYFAAVPAVEFHYPERKFFTSRSQQGQTAQMLAEVEALPGCRKAILFAHILERDDEALLSSLQNRGYVVLRHRSYRGAKFFEVQGGSTCG